MSKQDFDLTRYPGFGDLRRQFFDSGLRWLGQLAVLTASPPRRLPASPMMFPITAATSTCLAILAFGVAGLAPTVVFIDRNEPSVLFFFWLYLTGREVHWRDVLLYDGSRVDRGSDRGLLESRCLS